MWIGRSFAEEFVVVIPVHEVRADRAVIGLDKDCWLPERREGNQKHKNHANQHHEHVTAREEQ